MTFVWYSETHLSFLCVGFYQSIHTQIISREIDRSQVQLVDRLGEGRFSYVWKGVMYGVLPVTVKISKPSTAHRSHEAALLLTLKHPNIVQLYGVCSSQVPVYAVLEFMEHGSLCQYLRDGEGRSVRLTQLVNMASQVAAGMAYLEERNCVHRDLSASNVLVGGKSICKVANFDFAQVMCGSIRVAPSREDLPFKWTAPESIMCNRFTVKSDVWSFGVVLYEILTYGRLPYPGMTNTQVLGQLQQGYRMPRPMSCPDKLYDIMLNCWREEPECRPTFETLRWQLEELFVL